MPDFDTQDDTQRPPMNDKVDAAVHHGSRDPLQMVAAAHVADPGKA